MPAHDRAPAEYLLPIMEGEMERFTPGPWRVFTTRDGNKIIGIGEATGEGIVDCGFGIWRGGDEEALANANLISSAPDLYDLVKLFQRSVEYEIRRSEKDGDREGARLKTVTLNLIRAALAKATGGQP